MGQSFFDKLLVLDIDGTLIYSTEKKLDREHDFEVGSYYVYKRPGVDCFLENCLKWFEIGVWTSATLDYTQEIIRNLFGDIRKLSFLWCREKCTPRINNDENSLTFRSRYYVKDLKKLKKKGYPLKKIIVVEDSHKAVRRNYGNAVIVREYRGRADDDELFRLSDYLQILGPVENVREIEKRNWRSISDKEQG